MTLRVSLTGRRADVPPVMDEVLAGKFRTSLPPRLRMAKAWKLIYALDQHGMSMSTLYNKSRKSGPQVLAIRDIDGNVFGGFLSQELQPRTGYYGSGECFLWKVTDTNSLKIFRWTGKNNYCILSETSFIAMGGGDGKFGLWLDGEFDHGSSSTCATFENEPLVEDQSDGEFFCEKFELWGFQLT